MRLSLFSVWIAVADYQQRTSILLIEILYKWLIYSTRNSSGSVRYERFCLAYQQRGLCVAEITYGHCVTGTARLEADSGVKQRLISCISITVHCGSRTHRSARAYCFVCCSNKTALKWYCGALVLVFLKIFFHKGYLLCCQGSRRTESPDCRFTKLRNSKNRNHRISIDSSTSSQ